MPATPYKMPRATPADVVRSLLFYPAFYGGTVLLLSCAALVMIPFPGIVRWVCDHWSHWHRWCTRHILRQRVRIVGPVPTGAVLVAGKHESFFEAIDMPTLFDFPSVFAKAELMRLPVWGKLGTIYGLVGVEREQGAKALRTMVTAAKGIAAQGRPLVIFPEGTRVAHDAAPPLQAGFAGIYKMLGLPVIPLAVDSGPLYHRRWKKAGVITYQFGEPIPPGLPREEAEARVHAAMNALK